MPTFSSSLLWFCVLLTLVHLNATHRRFASAFQMFSMILPSPSGLHYVKRKTAPGNNKNVSEAYCMLDAVEETASGCVSLQGQHTWLRQLYLEVKLWAHCFPTVLSGARQTAVSWTKCLKDFKKKKERKKKLAQATKCSNLRTERMFFRVVLGSCLIHVLGSFECQVCLTIPVKPARWVFLTLHVASPIMKIQRCHFLAREAVRETTLIFAEGGGEKIKTAEPQMSSGEWKRAL